MKTDVDFVPITPFDVGYKILEDESVLLRIPKAKQQELIKILNRALNCWPDCPPEWKHLADILQHGAPLQNYYEQPAHRTRSMEGQPTPDDLSQLKGYPKEL